MLTTDVENFPGFPDGIMGPELMMKFREQAMRFGAEFLTEKVTTVDFSASGRSGSGVRDDAQSTADAVIVSTGAQSLMLGLEAEAQAARATACRPCATCDGFFFRGHEIAVVGGGDSAVEEAPFLTKFADKVTLDPPPRHAAGVEDHAGPGLQQPEDRVHVEHRRRRPASATRSSRVPSCATC